MEALLPIGTVLYVNGFEKKVMIIGVCQEEEDEDGQSGKLWDYVGVTYPEGFCGEEYTLLFDADRIENVVHEGHRDAEQKYFAETVAKALEDEAMAMLETGESDEEEDVDDLDNLDKEEDLDDEEYEIDIDEIELWGNDPE